MVGYTFTKNNSGTEKRSEFFKRKWKVIIGIWWTYGNKWRKCGL